MKMITRTLHPQIRVLDSKAGLVEYVASDESIDSYREIIKADGWRFNHFQKNAPFVDSHDYESTDKLLGRVVDFKVMGKQLVETVQWAIDVAENKMAQLGWKMTEAGYLKAVSVGFMPTKMVTKWDSDPREFKRELSALQKSDTEVRAVYQEQEQIELSSCIIGANPNALARAYKAEVISDADLEMISRRIRKRESDISANDPGEVELSRRQARAQKFSEKLRRLAARF